MTFLRELTVWSDGKKTSKCTSYSVQSQSQDSIFNENDIINNIELKKDKKITVIEVLGVIVVSELCEMISE